jgi:diacylglycerol kinase (ATP)
MDGDGRVAQADAFHEIVVVLNPVSGRGRGLRMRGRIVAWADRAPGGARVRVLETTAGATASSLAAAAVADGCDLVVAAGGDGTLNGVINGLGTSDIAVGLIPLGTGNDFARTVGVPREPARAMDTLLSGTLRRLDAGCRDGRRFINVAGCGFDAVVAARVNAGGRRLRGVWAYLVAVADVLRTFRPALYRVRVDGETLETEAMLCAVANGASYGGGMRVAPDARPDDGRLDVCLVRSCGKLEFLRAFPRVFRGTHLSHPKVWIGRGEEVSVICTPEQPVLMDGELVAPTPARFSALPGAVRFVTPLTAGPGTSAGAR